MSRIQQFTERHGGSTMGHASATILAALVAVCLSGRAAGGAAPEGYRAYSLASVGAAQVVPELKAMLATLPNPVDVVADSQGGRILVQGSAEAHAMTAKFVHLIDRTSGTRQRSQPQLKAYPVPANLPQVASQLVGRYSGRNDVRISSDLRTGQILIVAPPEVHAEVARQLEQVPPKPAAPGAAGSPAIAAHHSSPHGQAGHVAGSGSRPPNRSVGLDATTLQHLPLAPAAGGSAAAAVTRPPTFAGMPTAATQLAAAAPGGIPAAAPAAAASQPSLPPATAAPAQPSPTEATVAQPLLLRHITWQTMHKGLERLLEQRLPTTTLRSDQGERVQFQLQAAPDAEVAVEAGPAAGQITLSGRPDLVRSWVQVVGALDAPANASGAKTELVAVRAAQPQTLRRALTAIQTGAAPRSQDRDRMVAMLFQPKARPTAESAAADSTGQAEQPGEQSEPDKADPPGTAFSSEGLGPATADLLGGGAIGPVDIQFLEGSDVIVIRGHERDVARVRQLIEQIEQLSKETEPEVAVHALEHVSSEALGVLLENLYEEVYLPRQGAVSITPLVKPNALLLIGRKENVKTVIDLVAKLDQPVPPATQFRVFRLKHASAVEAKTTIDEFLNTEQEDDQAGLPVRGRVTADFRSNSLIVQASPRDLVEIAALVARIDTSTSEAVNEVRIFQLENALADDLVQTLQSAIEQQGQAAGAGRAPGGGAGQAGGGQQSRSTALSFLSVDNRGQQRLRSGILTDVRITADPRANAVVVSAPAESMGLIAGLIRAIDQIPAPEAQVKVFTVVNGDATSMAEVLGELFGQQRTGAGVGATTGTAGNPLVQMRFSVDLRTNAIIATGMENDLAVVEAVLLRLDESDVQERKTNVYRLKNSPAEAVSAAVNDWLQSERAVEQLAPGEASPFQQIQQEVVVVPEVVSNSLIVSATPRYYEEIRSLVEQLDKRPPMVNVQVLIAEVGLNDTDEFGVELGLQDGLLFDRSIVESLLTTTSSLITQDQGTSNTVTQDVIQSAPIAPGFNFNSTSPLGNNGGDRALANASNVAGQALSNFQLGRLNDELGYGGLVLSASSSGVNILLRALQATRRLEILSRPQIMTLDNQAAYIQVGQQVPRIIGTSINVGVQQNQIQDESVGIILGVTPRISPDGLVVMQIDAIKSEVGPEAEGIPVSINEVGDVIKSPRIDRIFAQTTVAAVSGQTIVLAGLITKRTEDAHRRVPFLSEIPVLGHLFRYDRENQKRFELLIILTPRVVNSVADADLIKQVEASRMSWCLSDVIKMHGVSGLRGRRDAWGDDETTTIYPSAIGGLAEPIPTPAGTLPLDGYEIPTPAVPVPRSSRPVPAPAGQRPQAFPVTPPNPLTPQLKPAVPPRGASSSNQPSVTPTGYIEPQTGQPTYGQVQPAAYGVAAGAAAQARPSDGPAPVHLPPLGRGVGN